MILYRVFLLIRRFFTARKFGIAFKGTSSFRMPNFIWLNDRMLEISVPAEAGAGLDFISLALDDEYGLRRMQPRPETVLDIGANFGLFSLLAGHFYCGARIHAYEPNPRTFPFTANNLSAIKGTAFQEGIGARAGFAEIRELGESRLAMTIPSLDGSIQITSLSEAVERIGGAVDLLKLDCEGAEWAIFEDEEAFRRVRVVRMEYHLTEGRDLRDLEKCITKLGFRIDRLMPNRGFGIAWASNRRRDISDS